MGLFSQVGKGLLAGIMTGSAAGGMTALLTNSMLAGLGVGVVDNVASGWLSYGFGNAWTGNYGWGGFYEPRHLNAGMGWDVASMYGRNAWNL